MEARRLTERDKTWLRQRKAVLKKIKQQVWLYLGEEPPEIRDYALEYKRDLRRAWRASEMPLLHEHLLKSQIVLGGDFHPFAQAQRTHLRLLRFLQPQRKLCLALEVFFVEHQSLLDKFLRGEMQEDEFLDQIEWEKHWGFPWSHYRPLVEFAKRHQCPILALNGPGLDGEAILQSRDDFAAQQIGHYHRQNPEELIYGVYGDLHIAQKHLPEKIRKNFAKEKLSPALTTIYVNPERVYFQLARKGLENNIDVVQFTQNQFAILSSPPWVKWQNYLMYLEDNYDYFFEDFDFDEDDEEMELADIDFTDHVASSIDMIASALGLEFKADDIQVYTARDHGALDKIKRIVGDKFFPIARFLVSEDSSFYLPQRGFFYLSKPSVNHVAPLAAQYVHAKMSQREEILWDCPRTFINLIWVEAMGFLLSKFINPKRKAENLQSLKKKLAVFQPQDEGRESMLVALDQKMIELLEIYRGGGRERQFRPRKRASYIEAARFLGGMLGERYFRLYDKRKIDREFLLKTLSFNPCDATMTEFYYQELRRLDQWELEDGSDE